MRIPVRLAVLTAMVLIGLPALAAAEPGEPPVDLLSPADAARVAPDIDGIAVSFTCPPTTAYKPYGAETSYGVDLSRGSDLGANGRLAAAVGSGTAVPRSGDPGTCDARLGSGDAPRPQVTPGTYYWQAWRYCDSCAAGYETSPVRAFVIGLGGSVRLAGPSKAYAGYPIAFDVRSAVEGVYDSLAVERRAGGAWKAVAVETRGAIVGGLPKGRQTLRAIVRSGSQTVVSATRTVTVAAAKRWTTSRRDDGAYRDARRPSLRLTIGGAGRRITRLQAPVAVDCTDLSFSSGIRPDLRTVALSGVPIAPDGRFALSRRISGQDVTLIGRLSRRVVQISTLRYSGGSCAGSVRLTARHA